jgi:hypothetical protein
VQVSVAQWLAVQGSEAQGSVVQGRQSNMVQVLEIQR